MKKYNIETDLKYGSLIKFKEIHKYAYYLCNNCGSNIFLILTFDPERQNVLIDHFIFDFDSIKNNIDEIYECYTLVKNKDNIVTDTGYAGEIPIDLIKNVIKTSFDYGDEKRYYDLPENMFIKRVYKYNKFNIKKEIQYHLNEIQKLLNKEKK